VDEEKVFPKLADFFGIAIPQSDCVIVFPFLALDGSSATSRYRQATGRKGNAEDRNFVPPKAAVAHADGKRHTMAAQSKNRELCAPVTVRDPSGDTAMPAIVPLWPLNDDLPLRLSKAHLESTS
jgi:hypothetical protein